MVLKDITFTFENCDSITIHGDAVGDFYVGDLVTTFEHLGHHNIQKIDTCRTFFIEIHKSANQPYYEFEQQEEYFKKTVFERILAWDDLSSISFSLIDETNKILSSRFYYLGWVGDNEFSNDAQHSFVSDLGHLYIFVSQQRNIKAFLNTRDLKNETIINTHFNIKTL